MRYVFLALLASGPAHGYQLKRRHDALFASGWGPINIGQIYVTLGRLERDGLVTHRTVQQAGRSDRKVYELTELGRKALETWLGEPPDVPLPKSDLLLKLVSASLVGAPDAPDAQAVVGAHRQRCLQALRDLDGAVADAAPARWRRCWRRAPGCTCRLSCAGSTCATSCSAPVRSGSTSRETTMPDPHTDHAAVAAAGLVKTYATGSRRITAVRGVDLQVAAGEWISIMGPSGCGKSTLLYLLGGLDVPYRGSVHVAGRDVSGGSESQRAGLRRALVGYVFQAANLVPDLSVAENVELPAELAGAGRRVARRRARELLEELGLGETLGAAPGELSGGEQQRVALARALVNRPLLLLADEPTGALDTDSARTVLGLLRRMHHGGQTIVLGTHDHRVAAAADRVLVMQDGAIGDERRLAEPGAGSLLAQLPPLEVS